MVISLGRPSDGSRQTEGTGSESVLLQTVVKEDDISVQARVEREDSIDLDAKNLMTLLDVEIKAVKDRAPLEAEMQELKAMLQVIYDSLRSC